MCVAAAAGRVQWEGVLIAGALGGATGDQFWFYLLRGRIDWLDRYPWMARHRDAVVHRVKDKPEPDSRHQPVSAGPSHRDSHRVRVRETSGPSTSRR